GNTGAPISLLSARFHANTIQIRSFRERSFASLIKRSFELTARRYLKVKTCWQGRFHCDCSDPQLPLTLLLLYCEWSSRLVSANRSSQLVQRRTGAHGDGNRQRAGIHGGPPGGLPPAVRVHAWQAAGALHRESAGAKCAPVPQALRQLHTDSGRPAVQQHHQSPEPQDLLARARPASVHRVREIRPDSAAHNRASICALPVGVHQRSPGLEVQAGHVQMQEQAPVRRQEPGVRSAQHCAEIIATRITS
uniref:Histone H3 n=1 Tax=Macrostomum lignano TaxID=282301 RepID=A0A1I8FIL8_9PLAT